MYKRPANKNGFQYKEPKSKMPKLEVSLNGASNHKNSPKPTTSALQLQRPSTSKVVTSNPSSSSAHSNRKPDVIHQTQSKNVQPQPQPQQKDENLWADADDEFILIASQMVDNMDMDAINQQIIVQSMNMSQSNDVEPKITNDVLENFLHSTEEDDRLFSEMHNFDNYGNPDMHDALSSTVIQKTPNQANHRPISPPVFKVPHDRPVTMQSNNQIDMNLSFRPDKHPQSTQFSQHIEVPRPVEPTDQQVESQNIKVKYLTQKQCELQKDIEHLNCENQRLTELCQTKDSESSLLRSENERLKNQFDNMRKEKSAEISKVRNDLSLKMLELEKIILDLKSQLQFKEISSMQLQNRKLNCTQPSELPVRPASETVSNSQNWEKFKLPIKSSLFVQAAKPVDPRMYISSKLCDSYWVSVHDKRQWEHLNGLQLILSDLASKKDFNNNGRSKMLDDVFELASLSVAEMFASSMRTQIDSKKNDFSYTHSDIGEWKEYSLVSEKKLFDREEAFLSRRIVVCLAIICEQYPEFSSALFRLRGCENDGDKPKNFLETLSLTIKNFSHHRNVAHVQGFIESSCLLLQILAKNDDIDISKSTKVFASILHNILLCRPGIGSLEKISKFIELMSCRTEKKDFLDVLCLSRNTCDIFETQAYIRYTTDSCTLQLYALHIRLYTLPHEKRKFSIKQLTTITQSILLFMRYAILELPKWLVMERRGSCFCRAKLFGAAVTLLYVYLQYWIEHPGEIDPQSVAIVSKFGVEFFYENLVKNYDDELLNCGGIIIKNRIRIIVEWLNTFDFEFKSAHKHALQSVVLQRLGPMVEYLRYNKNVPSKYSAEAADVYRHVVDSFFEEFD